MFGLSGDVPGQIDQILRQFHLEYVAYTRGASGSLLCSIRGCSYQPGVKTAVVDTVGAGDAFTATMTLGLLSGWDLDRINAVANQVASYVCSQAGATPAMPEQFRALFSR
jgi:fructokinase